MTKIGFPSRQPSCLWREESYLLQQKENEKKTEKKDKNKTGLSKETPRKEKKTQPKTKRLRAEKKKIIQKSLIKKRKT